MNEYLHVTMRATLWSARCTAHYVTFVTAQQRNSWVRSLITKSAKIWISKDQLRL